ncbi:G-protein coupled receptor 143-like [Aquarana catesbeiana]|uniref:G-protein coupled receptor 143-like n=1 Tax=Aquarana catesbeiana TaxID=8400 RepID=UPI003CC94F98
MHCAVYTSSERFRKHNLCRRLLGIYGAFLACWLGNVLCDFMLLLVEVLGTPQAPRQIQVAAQTLFVITGILNPVFCCVHSLAFFGWRSSSPPLCVKQCGGAAMETPPATGEKEGGAAEEEYLLQGRSSAHTSGKLSIPPYITADGLLFFHGIQMFCFGNKRGASPGDEGYDGGFSYWI